MPHIPLHRRTALLLCAAALLITPPAPSHAQDALSGLEVNSLSGTYLAGRAAGLNRDVDIAADLFGRALDLDPNNPALIERAFLFDLSSGNIARAENLAPKVIQIASEHRLARTVLGLRDFRLKRYAKAREHFRKAEFTPIGELAAAMFTAWSFAAEKNGKQALTALNALDTNEAFAGFKAYHGALIADLSDQKLKAEDFYRESLALSPNSMRVVQAYGSYLERNDRKDEARAIYEDYLKASPGNALVATALADLVAGRKAPPFLSDANAGMAEALFSLASALTDEESIDVALIYAQLSLSVATDSVVARTLLGDINGDIGRYEKAIEAFEAVPLTSPLKAGAELQIALNLDKLERRDEALARLAKLLEANPANYEAHVTMGNLLRAAEKWIESGEAYSRALALVPNPERRHWTLFYSRGITAERIKDWPRAEADFRKALELEPDQPLVLNYLGYSFVEKGENLSEAMDMIRKAVELRPNDGYIVDSLGWAHYQLGEYEQAVKHLERAVELKPEDPVINDHLGDAYWRIGRKLEAGFQWQHARDSEPDDKLKAEIDAKLANGLPDRKAPAPAATQAPAQNSVN
jgi:tetratricopeptide (TPR) repeat protein